MLCKPIKIQPKLRTQLRGLLIHIENRVIETLHTHHTFYSTIWFLVEFASNFFFKFKLPCNKHNLIDVNRQTMTYATCCVGDYVIERTDKNQNY